MLELIAKFLEKNFHCQIHLQTMLLPHEDKAANSQFIREQMNKYLTQQYQNSDPELMDIINVPQAIALGDQKRYASISHTGKKAIFAISDNHIGIDIEDPTRVNLKVLQRVTAPEELKLTSEVQTLWSIKEASFKAIPFIVQPKVITDIEIKKLEDVCIANTFQHYGKKFLAKVKSHDDMSLTGIVVNFDSVQLCVSIILKQ